MCPFVVYFGSTKRSLWIYPRFAFGVLLKHWDVKQTRFLSNYLTVCNSHPFYIKNTGTQVASAPGIYFSSRFTLWVFSLRIFWVCSSKPRVSPENTPSVLHGFIFCWVRSDRHFTCNSKTEFFYLLAKKNFYLYIAYKSTDNLLEPKGHT